MQNTFFFIVNSRIGGERIAALEQAIQLHLAHAQVTIRKTGYGGHATELAKEGAGLQDTLVVAVGGDGTVNEVIQVLAESGKPMGIVPTGSGNGLARHCGIPVQIDAAVALLAKGYTAPIDLGIANGRYFISNAGVGFDARVCDTIKHTNSRGLKMYIRKVIQMYFGYRKDEYRVQYDGGEFTRKAFFLNVANGKEFGYGFQIAPGASLQDGLLDGILVKNMNFFNGLRFVWDGWRKRLHENRNCIYFRSRKIRISGSDLKVFQTDGDAHDCGGSCEIEVKENALLLLVPFGRHDL